MKKKEINGKDFFTIFRHGAMEVIRNKEHLNRINVFPVADGDTGNNLALTLNSVLSYTKVVDSFSDTVNSMAEASIYGARGNSGVIFAQYISGIAIASEGKEKMSLKDFIEAVKKAAEGIYDSLSAPVEGTMLTVMKGWAYYLSNHRERFQHVEDLFLQSIDEANIMLQNTPEQLAILKEHNVVDSGAKGFVYYLEGIIKYFKGEVLEDVGDHFEVAFETADIEQSHGNLNYRFCTECLIKGNPDKDSIKAAINDLGDSIIVAGSTTLKHVHIHTNDVSAFFKKVAPFGVLERPKVEDMVLQEQLKGKQKKVAILTDSIGDFPLNLREKYDIHVLPVNLFVGENHYLDKLTVDPYEFYETIKHSPIYPNSSQPNDFQVKQKLDFLKDHYKSVIAVMVSKQLSGTYESVRKYGDKLKENGYPIEVIDSRLNSAAQGLLVVRLGEALSDGADLEELVKITEEWIPRTEIYVALDTFANSLKSGRVPKVVGQIGTLFKLRPIISLDKEGKGTAFSIALTRKALMNKIKKMMAEKHNEKPVIEYSVVFSKDRKDAENFAKELQDIVGKPPKYLTEVSSVTALHVGEGAIAVGLVR